MKLNIYSHINVRNHSLLILFVCVSIFSVVSNKTNGAEMKDKILSKPVIKTVMGQPSYIISTGSVEAALTVEGGQLGPVTFKLGQREIQPFSVTPWWNEKVSSDVPPVARNLRGDLFCLPFGLNLEPFHGEQHPVHGETANNKWNFEEISSTADRTSLHVSMDSKIRPGRIDKWVTLRAGQPVIYQKHKIYRRTYR